MIGLMRVELPWATFGLVVDGGRCTEAAPLARWCQGRHWCELERYWRRRGATITYIRDQGDAHAARSTQQEG